MSGKNSHTFSHKMYMSKVELNVKGNVTETLIDSWTLNGFFSAKMYLLLLVLRISQLNEDKKHYK